MSDFFDESNLNDEEVVFESEEELQKSVYKDAGRQIALKRKDEISKAIVNGTYIQKDYTDYTKDFQATELNDQTVSAFLKDLTELTKKHGIEICGCGCCGSPWLAVLDKRTQASEDYSYKCESDNFEVLTFTKE